MLVIIIHNCMIKVNLSQVLTKKLFNLQLNFTLRYVIIYDEK